MASKLVMVSLSVLVACSSSTPSSSPSGGRLVVNVGTEGPAFGGFAFPPAGSEGGFVDGWEVRFNRIVVTVDAITLSADPDKNPTNQAETGPEVATKTGPWAIDLTRLKTEAGEPVATFEGLDPSSRYAFGFSTVAASATAKRIGIDPNDADYARMIEEGASVLYTGTATFKGGDACTSSDPSYSFASIPKVVSFRFSFKTPTRSLNCQNTSLRGKAFAGEQAQRGVQVLERGDTTAHIVVHVDHPFWNTVDHDAAELFFDQIAARAKDDGTVTLDDLALADPTSLRDRDGKPLPWRSCTKNKPVRSGTRAFDSGSVPVDRSAPPDRALRNYADYVGYLQSTEGHLEADGLCAVDRRYASPR